MIAMQRSRPAVTRQMRKLMRAAGFSRPERRDFLVAFDTPGPDLTPWQKDLLSRFESAAVKAS
jgi:hypothetical protein